ncbi:MAG: DNA polymerase III subunit alpha [Chlorobi bacterium]|nr:DNA polymerase III subunit alpha [Chlorobiota bacterium]
MIDFTHLHVHTQYSILDGASPVPTLIAKAKQDGMSAIAITDHGNLFGVKAFHDQCTREGLKPILGCEMYVASGSRFEQKEKSDRSGYHLIVLAKNKTGYYNLIKLVSLAWIEGFYYKPRIDKELLEKYHEGLIVSSACLGGEIPQTILNHSEENAEKTVRWYHSVFGDDFYLELQRHPTGNPDLDRDVYERQKKVNESMVRIARKLEIKLIATNDVHFVNQEDAEAHDHLICINTGTDLQDESRLRYTQQEWFKTREEMETLFSDIPEALENTRKIVDKVEYFELNRPPLMPDFPLPESFDDDNTYLQYLAYEGAKRRYGEITDTIKERLDYELSVIKKMGYPGYFLIVQDFLNAARKMGVSVGPGRGSAAGSVVAYCTHITDIDPLKYNLLFERFLNPERISLPDIDIDFDEDGRDKVLKYVVDKYGRDHVAHIITFGTMAAKSAIRDVARVEGLPLNDADRLAKLVPGNKSLSDAYRESKDLQKARESDHPLIRKTLRFAEQLEGSVRHTGLHACGIIIGKDHLIDNIPVCTSKDTDLLVTQFDGDYIESVGMLKMDFLGLKNLSIIQDALKIIKQSKGVEIDIENLPLDDQKTYELYARGETIGIFQFESEGMKKFLKDLKPNRFEDLIAMNALFRPGPMDYLPQFINRKHGKEKIHYDIPEMEKYLKETYGITVYQEQVMLLSQELAGFTGGEADLLRKAMGKKKQKEMDNMRSKFIAGAKKKGYDEKVILKIWHDWESFAKYAFNKSHATSYAYLSYQTAYLKAYYPAEFMAAVLSRNISDIKKITKLINETRRMGISILGPDINESEVIFTVNKAGNIRFGLNAIKGVGEQAAIEIIREREKNGLYHDIYDLVTRVNLFTVNKKNIEALAIAGAFDTLGQIERHQFFLPDKDGNIFIDTLIRYGNKIRQEKNSAQQSLFGESHELHILPPEPPEGEPWSKVETLSREKEIIGIYLSSHPLDEYQLEIGQFCNATLADLEDLYLLLNKEITVAGIVTFTKEGISKNNKPYGTLTIQDYTGSFRFILFNSEFLEMKKYFQTGYLIMVKGKISKNKYRNNEPEFKIKTIHLLNEVREEMIKTISLRVPLDIISADFVNELKHLFDDNGKGKTELKFSIYDQRENLYIEMFSRNTKVQITNKLVRYLTDEKNIEFIIN